MAEKRRGLGRGLGALISGNPSTDGEDRSAAELSDSLTLDSIPSPTGESARPASSTPNPALTSNDVPRETKKMKAAPSDSRETETKKPTTSVSRGTSSTPRRADADSRRSAPTSTSQPPRGTPSTSEAPDANSSKAATAKRGSASPRKSRPVDMFFSPGVPEDPSGTDSDASTSASSAGNRSRRRAVPDVLGHVMQPKDSGAGSDNSSKDPASVSAESSQGSTGDSGSDSIIDTEGEVSRETLVAVPGASFAEIPVSSIHPNRKQPRTAFDEDDMAELVHSIREVGLLQPIVVRPSTENGEERYELVMGERRWRAVQAAGLAKIPAIIRNTSNTDLLRDALLENLHRSQLNPLEEAAAYQQLLQEFECTQDELSERIGRSRPQISNTIRLMKLPALVQRRVAAGVLSSGHARALLALADSAEMERLAQRIVNEGLSVRATEELVAMNDGLRRPTREKSPRATARHERLDYLANSLSDQLDTTVKISLGAKKGRVSIEFGSVEDLNRIMSVISPTSNQ